MTRGSGSTASLLFLCVLLLGSVLDPTGTSHAQTLKSAVVQTVNGTPSVMATADFNHDGRADVVYQDSYTGGALHVMFGNGDSTFREVQQITLPPGVGAHITAADINGDGFADLIIGYNGFDSNFTPAEFTVLLNKGDGTFGVPIYSPFPSDAGPDTAVNIIAVADFNGDGNMDFIFNASAGALLMAGDGTGHFTPSRIFKPNDVLNDVFVGDFNGDGKPDIAINGIFGIYYALNTGSGTFAPATLYNILMNPPTGFYVADVNRDGNLDILFGANGSLWVAYGNGDGSFRTPIIRGTAPPPVYFAILAVRDTNGDGMPDIITTNDAGPVVDLQSVSGAFSTNQVNGPAVGNFGLLAPVYADFDGDGIPDILSVASGALVFSKGKPDGTFNGANAILTAGDTLDLRMADFNLDGKLDAVITTGGGSWYGTLATYLGDGAGNFSLQDSTSGSGPYAGQSSIADFNHDGIPDVFNSGFALYGDGLGNFANAPLIANPPSGNHPTGFTVVADFNEDGIPDAATTSISSFSSNATISVAVSSGPNTWLTTQVPVSSYPGPLVTADFNHDSHQDLAIASLSDIFVYSGDGKGDFTLSQQLPIGYTAGTYYGEQTGFNDLEAADVDGDGNIDLLVPIPDKNILQIFYGRSDGTFDPPVSLQTSQDVRYVTVHDMDGDGIPDLILSGHALVRILHGTGNRSFEAIPTSFAANPYPQKVRVADVNNDGKPDLLVPNGGYSAIAEAAQTFTVLLSNTVTVGDATKIRLTCEPSTINVGTTSLLTAVVTSVSGTPTGVVAFADNGAALATQNLGNGITALTYSGAVAGNHAIVAEYTPTGSFFPSSATCSVLVAAEPTTSVLTVKPQTATVNSPVTLTAQVNSASNAVSTPPTGTVTFSSNGSTIGQATLAAATASITRTNLAAGTDQITCQYSGDSVYQASPCNIVPVTITALPVTLTLTSSLNPASAFQPITLTAHLASTSQSFSPSGAIAFFSNGNPIGTSTLSAAGTATLTVNFPAGTNTLTASYAATATCNCSSTQSNAITEVVAPDATTTSLTVSPNAAAQGATVNLTAQVAPASSQTAAAGSVIFYDGTNSLASTALSASGSATFSSASFAVGTHSLTAVYSGSSNDQPSTSTPQTLTINPQTFILSVPATLTIQTQHHATLKLTLTSVGGFADAVNLGCGSLPQWASCNFNDPSVVLAANQTVPFTIDIDTDAVLGYRSELQSPLALRSGLALALLTPVWLLASPRRRRLLKRTSLLIALLLTVSLVSLTGCSGLYPPCTTPGSYTVTIEGHGAKTGLRNTTTFTLIVTR